MKKRAAKTALILLEIAAVLIGIAGAGALFLYWRLGQGPVSLNLLAPSAEIAIRRQLPEGFSADIQGVTLVRTDRRSAVDVIVSDLEVTRDDETTVARADDIKFLFDFGDILRGKTGARTVSVSGSQFHIVRNENKTLEVPGVQRKPRRMSPSFTSFLRGGVLRSAFERADIVDAQITFLDAASGRRWVAPAAKLEIRRDDDDLFATLDGAIDTGDAPAALIASGHYNNQSGVISASVEGKKFPVGDILTMFYGDSAGILDAPVTGKAVFSLAENGEVLASNFTARVGNGTLKVGALERDIEFIDWHADFDPDANAFAIENLSFEIGGSRGAISGDVAIALADDKRQPERILFDLSSSELVLAAENFFSVPLTTTNVRLRGGYQLSERRLSLTELAAQFAGLAATGQFSFDLQEQDATGMRPSPGIVANIDFANAIDPERLMQVWPLGVAMGARDWIEDRVENATIDNIKFEIDLPAGVVAEGGGLPDEAMALSFDVRDARVFYVKQMTPLTGGRASGVVRGNSFRLEASNAKVGDVAIPSGEIEFPTFIPKWEPTYYRFVAVGKSEELLGLIDQNPLNLLSKIQLSPDQFVGNARAEIEIVRPNKRDALPEEYRYSGKATFEDMTVTDIVGDIELVDAAGAIDLKARSMKVTAAAQLSDAPINIVWDKNFYAGDGPSEMTLSGVIDSSTADLFGIASRRFLRGPISFSAKAVGEIGAIEALDVEADLERAALTIDPLGWRKAADVPATADVALSFANGGMDVNKIDVRGDGVEVDGALSFAPEGLLLSAEFSRFYLADAADLSFTATRDPAGLLDITALGSYLNGAALAEQIVNEPSGSGGGDDFDWGLGVSVTARIESFALRNGVEYRDASFDLRRDAERLQALDFSGFDHNGPPLTVSMSLTGAETGPSRVIEARGGAIGNLLAGVFGVSSISGGDGSMLIELDTESGKGFSGVLEARDLNVVEAPLLARIFSAGSFDGLANLLNGEGIDLSYAYGEFEYADRVLSLRDMRATGPSVGITAEGSMALGQGGNVDLGGAVAPIYQLNSVLGNAPIIGDILVGRKGEGIVALSYSVTGEAASPNVFVNPLSAITPGILRRLFETERTPVEAESAAAPVAPAESALDVN